MKAKKTKLRVSIPSGLEEFFRQVRSRIKAKDKATLIESDDLLQSNAAHGGSCTIFGGLVDDRAGVFGFTYFPDMSGGDAEDETVTWELRVDRQEIHQMATGKVHHLNLWKCPSLECKSLHPSPWSHCSYCDGPLPSLNARLEQLSGRRMAKRKP